MKKYVKNIFFLLVVYLLNTNILFADDTYFIDFTKVLNQSQAGASAQEILKKKFANETEKFKKEEQNIKNMEKDLISQKQALKPEDYQKKVQDLRDKVFNLQKEQQASLNNIAKSRNQAKQELLKAVNPIISEYMSQNNIRIIVNKESVVLGDTKLEITDKIIEIVNQKVKSISVN